MLAYNAGITRLLLCRLNSDLPLNTVNPKKPRMPNVANRVDAIVMPHYLQVLGFSIEYSISSSMKIKPSASSSNPTGSLLSI